MSCVTLSVAALAKRDGKAGLHWTDAILGLDDRLGVKSIADTLETRGNHYVNAERPVDAVRCYGAAHHQNVQIGRRWPRHPGTAELLALAHTRLSDAEYDRAWASGERLAATNLVRDWL